MTSLLVFIAAFAPVAWLLWTIYSKDDVQPEPPKWLVKAFSYGVISVFVALVVVYPLESILGLDTDNESSISFTDAVAKAFVLAAIPEELAKFLMFWLVIRKNPFFDEHSDGIVYSVCVGLGFAALENIFYLLGGISDGTWVTTGIVRALISVPGHYFFAILMGYYYSLYHFGIDRGESTKFMILLAPILAHGLFDTLLFSAQIDESLSGLFMILFIIFFSKLRKRAKKRLNELL